MKQRSRRKIHGSQDKKSVVVGAKIADQWLGEEPNGILKVLQTPRPSYAIERMNGWKEKVRSKCSVSAVKLIRATGELITHDTVRCHHATGNVQDSSSNASNMKLEERAKRCDRRHARMSSRVIGSQPIKQPQQHWSSAKSPTDGIAPFTRS